MRLTWGTIRRRFRPFGYINVSGRTAEHYADICPELHVDGNMDEDQLPECLLKEKEVLIGEIVTVFAGISRAGGTSWGQASAESRAHARWMEDNSSKPGRLFDGREASWRQLQMEMDADEVWMQDSGMRGGADLDYHDRDASWLDLVEDVEWDPEPTYGGFSWLDPIGCRYYLPAAMLRSLQEPYGLLLCYPLTVNDINAKIVSMRPELDWRAYFLEKWSALNNRERMTVKHFVKFKMDVDQGRFDAFLQDIPEPFVDQVKGALGRLPPWSLAYASHWESLEDM